MSPALNVLWPLLLNHLWQSTVFVAMVWLITLLLRRRHARIRYGLWLAASLKFLLPFSLLTLLGSMLPQRSETLPPAEIPLYASLYTSGDAVGRSPFANPQPVRLGEQHVDKSSWNAQPFCCPCGSPAWQLRLLWEPCEGGMLSG